MEFEIFQLLKISLLLFFAYLFWEYALKIYYKYWFYTRQGIPVVGGFPLPFFGNLLALKKYSERDEVDQKLTDFYYNYYREQYGLPEDQIFFKLPPLTLDFKATYPQLCVNDPELMTDIYVTKNKYFDKTEKYYRMFKKMIGSALVFLPSNETWQRSRKIVSQMFYKDKITKMIPQINLVTSKHMKIWKEQKSTFDSEGFQLFFQVNKMLIDVFSQCVFGFRDEELVVEEKVAEGIYIKKTLGTLTESIGHKMLRKVLSFSRIFFDFFDEWWIGEEEKILLQNIETLREAFRKLIREKQKKVEEQKKQGKDVELNDMMSLFLTNEYYANDEEFIVDECIEFLAAGTTTTSTLIVNLIIQAIQNPETVSKLREDLQANFFKPCGIEMGQDLGAEGMVNLVTLERIGNMPYLNYALTETLRISPSAVMSTPCIFTRDVTIGNYKIKAREEFNINILGIHHHPDYWIEPEKFIPERFDPKSKYFLTPSGQKRIAHCFIPFQGGSRVCLGKTFAENMAKVIALNVFSHFDFKFRDEKQMHERIQFHVALFKKKEVLLDLLPRS